MKPQFDPSNISNRSEDELECLLKILYTPEQYRTYEEDIARSMIE